MTDNIFIKEYQGFNIEYNPFYREFQLMKSDIETPVRKAPTQDKLEQLADTLIATKKKVEPPLPVLILDWNDLKPTKITSYDPQYQEAWTSMGNRRRKYSIKAIYKDNGVNRELFNNIIKIRSNIRAEEKQRRAYEEQLEHITEEDIVGKESTE